MTKLASKICKKGRGLVSSNTDKNKVWNFYGDNNVFEFEEELLQQQDKKLKKHYLNQHLLLNHIFLMTAKMLAKS